MSTQERFAARARVRAYCHQQGIGSANMAACLRQIDVLLANGNTLYFAERQAEAMADRIRDRDAQRATQANQPRLA